MSSLLTLTRVRGGDSVSMKTSSGGVSIGDGATQSTSYANSNSRWNNNNDDDDDGGSRSDSDESEDSHDNYHHSKPPPPRDDFFDDDDEYDVVDDEEEDDEYSQIGANPSNNDNNEQIIMQQLVASNNDSSIFGEDTLHILHHVESRLRTIVPSLPPPPPLTLSVSCSSPSTLRDCIDDSHAEVVAKATAEGAYCNDGMNTGGGDVDDYHNDDEGNDDGTDGSMSEEGIASLLRGPLMAARSVMSASSPHSIGGGGGVTQQTTPLSTIQQQQQQQQQQPQPKSSAVETPYTARERFLSSPQLSQTQQQQQYQPKSSIVETPYTAPERFLSSPQVSQTQQQHQHQPMSSIVETPSTARERLLSSPQVSQTQQQHQHQPKSSIVETPYTARERFLSSPQFSQTQQQQPMSSVLETPSTARERLLSSPQVQQHLLHPSVHKRQNQKQQQQQHTSSSSPHDSVSTMGQRSPSEGYNGSSSNYVNHGGGENGVGPTRVIFDIVDGTALSEKRDGRDIAKLTSTSNVVGIPNATSSSSSLDGRIALGEEQMMRSRTMNNNTTVVAATVMNSNHISDEMQQQQEQQSKHVAKKPFLRKGTRKEPSALHTFATTVTAPVTSIGNVGLTPSSFRRQQQHSPVATTNATSVNDNANNVNETLSDQLARLARLEKMQEDQIKDLERRQARKEEARRERRRLMTMNNNNNNNTNSSNRKATTHTAVPTSSPATTKRAITPNRHVVLTPSSKQNASSTSVVNDVQSPSQVCATDPKQQQTPVLVKEISTIESREIHDIDVITPSQARQNMFSSVSTMKKATVDEIVNKYISDGGIIIVDDGEENNTTTRMCVEGKEVKSHPSNVNCNDKENETNQRKNLAAVTTTTSATATMGTKPKLTHVKKVGSKSAPRPQSTTNARIASPGIRSTSSTARMRNDEKSSPLMSAINNDERKAFEEWKKKEEEQWALIKNMKKRQEVALREAEGERERAKAWAIAEKESVQKWATEQRALIKRDRHKAANMALVSSKAANKIRQQQQQEVDTDNVPSQNVTQVELEELRLQLKTNKDKDTAEIQMLKEVILRQERAIEALKCGKENDIEEGLTISNPTRSTKSVVGGHDAKPPRRGLQVREPTAGPSKQNTSRVQLKSKSKLPPQRKATNVINGSTKNGQINNVEVEEATHASGEGDEPTELWLQRNISKMNDANNELVVITDQDYSNDIQDGHHLISNAMDMQHRRPYNAADYDGRTKNETLKTTTTATTSNHHSEPSVPSFVTTNTILTPNPPSLNATKTAAAAVVVDGGVGGEVQSTKKSRIMTYKNGTQKEVTLDGTTTISFANGDRKRTYANEKKGVIVYYYASTKTTQVTHQDGMQTYHFPNKQVENHHTDGRKEITYPDGTIRLVDIDGTTDTTFPDGVRVVDYPNGTQRVIQG